MYLSVISTLGKFSIEKKTMVVQEENIVQLTLLLDVINKSGSVFNLPSL